MRKSVVFLVILAAITALSGCSNFQLPGVYRLVIQQGNIVTQDMVDQLQPGMTKRQVNYVLGTPLIMDTFHADRWDYLYTIRDQEGETREQRLTVYFQDDKLSHFEGDLRPSVASEEQPSGDNS